MFPSQPRNLRVRVGGDVVKFTANISSFSQADQQQQVSETQTQQRPFYANSVSAAVIY